MLGTGNLEQLVVPNSLETVFSSRDSLSACMIKKIMIICFSNNAQLFYMKYLYFSENDKSTQRMIGETMLHQKK